MCGPIVGSLKLPSTVGGNRWKALFLYQLGRGGVFILIAAAGALVSSKLSLNLSWLGWPLVALLFTLGLSKALGHPLSPQLPPRMLQLMSKIAMRPTGAFRPLAMGVVLAFLPCMLSFWAIGLAASTGSPVQATLAMTTFVLMTSLPLGIAIAGGDLFGRIRIRNLEAYALMFSAVWCGLMTAASMGWIPHAHYMFSLFGRQYSLMFW